MSAGVVSWLGAAVQKPVAATADGLLGSYSSPAICQRHEPVERHVVVEGPDHEVAVAIGRLAVEVVLVAVAVGIARDVEPVAAPPLAVLRRREQAVDQAFVCVRAIVVARMPRSLRASAAGRSGRRSRGGSECADRPRERASGSSPPVSRAGIGRALLRAQPAWRGMGGLTVFSGRKDQCSRSASVTVISLRTLATGSPAFDSDHRATFAIHRFSTAISPEESRSPLGGMRRLASSVETRSSRRLALTSRG